MRVKTRRQGAFAMIEYVVLVLVVIAALVAFRGYVQRGLQGQYKKSGETFGFGRQYSATASVECAYEAEIKTWYVPACFNNLVIKNRCTRNADYFGCVHAAMKACVNGCRE